MTNEHPITPPPELFKQWEDDILNERDNVDHVLDCAWRDGFRAGADHELEACCEWVDTPAEYDEICSPGTESQRLRAARRPKPPSLKERALEVLGRVSKDGYPCNYQDDEDWNTIRQALELLPDEVQ